MRRVAVLERHCLAQVLGLDAADHEDSRGWQAEAGVHGHVLGRAVCAGKLEAIVEHQVAQGLGLLAERITAQAIAKVDHAKGKVVLCEPVGNLFFVNVQTRKKI